MKTRTELMNYDHMKILKSLIIHNNDFYGKIMECFIEKNKEELYKLFFDKFLIKNFTPSITVMSTQSFSTSIGEAGKIYYKELLNISKIINGSNANTIYFFNVFDGHLSMRDHMIFHNILKTWFDKKDCFWNDLSNFDNPENINRIQQSMDLNLL